MKRRLTVLFLLLTTLAYFVGAGAVVLNPDSSLPVEFDPDAIGPGSGNPVGPESTPTGSDDGQQTQTTTATLGPTPEPTTSVPHTETPTQTTISTDQLDRVGIERWVHHFVNVERSDRALTNLSYDEDLQEIARYHSRDMVENDYFAHESPSGETREDRYEQFGYDCQVSVSDTESVTGGENLARTHAFAQVETPEGSELYRTEREVAAAIVRGWMNSEAHRENILRPYWENEGIGVVLTDGDEDGIAVYATQNFC